MFDPIRVILDTPEGEMQEKLLVLADWMEERGDERGELLRAEINRRINHGDFAYLATRERSEIMKAIGILPIEPLRDCNWKEAFGYAGEPGAYAVEQVPERALPNDLDTSVEPFSRFDVKRVIASVEGENDEASWLVVGELNDGRFFSLDAGCDYTGWD